MGKKKFLPRIDRLQAEATKILSDRKDETIREGLRVFLLDYEPLITGSIK
jgi:hypothetical protein